MYVCVGVTGSKLYWLCMCVWGLLAVNCAGCVCVWGLLAVNCAGCVCVWGDTGVMV